MAADTAPPGEIARFIDAQGHLVTAEITRSGLLVLLTKTSGKGLSGGHPALNRENVTELRNALDEYLSRESP
jgi:hypothetical protein